MHIAVDSLGELLALHVSDASQQDRAVVAELAEAVQQATQQSVAIAWVDQAYTGPTPREAAKGYGITLKVVKLLEAKRGFVLLPRRSVVERSFAWFARFRRLATNA